MDPRVAAARKAVATLRLRLLEKTDVSEVRQIAFEIAQKEFEYADDLTLEGVLCKEIGKTPWESFRRYGDIKHTTPALILQWIEKKGMPLDTQALFISEHYPHLKLEPEDLAQFMTTYDHGASQYPILKQIKDLKTLFKQITGFNYWHSFAREYLLSTEDDVPLF